MIRRTVSSSAKTPGARWTLGFSLRVHRDVGGDFVIYAALGNRFWYWRSGQ